MLKNRRNIKCNRKVTCEDDFAPEMPVDEFEDAPIDEAPAAAEGGVEVDDSAYGLLFETEDVAQLVAEVTGQDVEVVADDDAVVFTIGEDEFTVTPEEDTEILEAVRRPFRSRRPIAANKAIRRPVRRPMPARRPVSASTMVRRQAARPMPVRKPVSASMATRRPMPVRKPVSAAAQARRDAVRRPAARPATRPIARKPIAQSTQVPTKQGKVIRKSPSIKK